MEDTGLLQDGSDDLEADRIMEEWNEQQEQVTGPSLFDIFKLFALKRKSLFFSLMWRLTEYPNK